MKIKISELTGVALDFAVAQAMGKKAKIHHNKALGHIKIIVRGEGFKPTAIWNHGGPIIEKEKMELHPAGNEWSSDINRCHQQYGPTPLVAAMRSFVASKFGDEMEVPDTLFQ